MLQQNPSRPPLQTAIKMAAAIVIAHLSLEVVQHFITELCLGLYIRFRFKDSLETVVHTNAFLKC